jgi:hypothetical protein
MLDEVNVFYFYPGREDPMCSEPFKRCMRLPSKSEEVNVSSQKGVEMAQLLLLAAAQIERFSFNSFWIEGTQP